ncbi:hypothetical protein MAMMFC1_02195 [Methylomusa anaerophila]|uniref:Uncharacterized protein n=1 Tax=Methylomusa anaerophila TaxID=1930071 RepID=A0A348AKB3_9FIRM|nr:hypothetical protein MAMMFC1_02195 [Methylomusa anaerophila]
MSFYPAVRSRTIPVSAFSISQDKEAVNASDEVFFLYFSIFF